MVANLISRLASRADPQSITVERKTTANDAGGSPVETWSTHLANLEAVVDVVTGDQTLRYDMESNRGSGTVYVQAGLDITAADRLVIGTQYYRIQFVDTAMNRAAGDRLGYMALTVEVTSGETT